MKYSLKLHDKNVMSVNAFAKKSLADIIYNNRMKIM